MIHLSLKRFWLLHSCGWRPDPVQKREEVEPTQSVQHCVSGNHPGAIRGRRKRNLTPAYSENEPALSPAIASRTDGLAIAHPELSTAKKTPAAIGRIMFPLNSRRSRITPKMEFCPDSRQTIRNSKLLARVLRSTVWPPSSPLN